VSKIEHQIGLRRSEAFWQQLIRVDKLSPSDHKRLSTFGSLADTLFNVVGFQTSDIDPDQIGLEKLNWIEPHGEA
jgi:hypothetical protein